MTQKLIKYTANTITSLNLVYILQALHVDH